MVRKCHFDVTACAEARRLVQRAERSLRDLSSLWGQPARFARRLENSIFRSRMVVELANRKFLEAMLLLSETRELYEMNQLHSRT